MVPEGTLEDLDARVLGVAGPLRSAAMRVAQLKSDSVHRVKTRRSPSRREFATFVRPLPLDCREFSVCSEADEHAERRKRPSPMHSSPLNSSPKSSPVNSFPLKTSPLKSLSPNVPPHKFVATRSYGREVSPLASCRLALY